MKRCNDTEKQERNIEERLDRLEKDNDMIFTLFESVFLSIYRDKERVKEYFKRIKEVRKR